MNANFIVIPKYSWKKWQLDCGCGTAIIFVNVYINIFHSITQSIWNDLFHFVIILIDYHEKIMIIDEKITVFTIICNLNYTSCLDSICMEMSMREKLLM